MSVPQIQDDETAAKPTVLVVEDVAVVRMLVATYLRDAGFEVVEAADTDQAIGALSSSLPVHVVFTDVNMPGTQDGFGLAQWTRKNRPDVRIVFGSGVAGTAQKAEAFGYKEPIVAKPYHLPELAHRLRLVLAEKP